jgi:hypothetical protein
VATHLTTRARRHSRFDRQVGEMGHPLVAVGVPVRSSYPRLHAEFGESSRMAFKSRQEKVNGTDETLLWTMIERGIGPNPYSRQLGIQHVRPSLFPSRFQRLPDQRRSLLQTRKQGPPRYRRRKPRPLRVR